MKTTKFNNLLGGGFLAALALFGLSGCATSKQQSASVACRQCETKWVAVQNPPALAVANASYPFGSVVSPIGDAPGEGDLAHAQTWQWERYHFCCVVGAAASLGSSDQGERTSCACPHCQSDGGTCCSQPKNVPLTVAAKPRR